MTDLACVFLADDTFLGFHAGDVVRTNFRTTTVYSADHIAYANYGYLAALLAEGVIQPLTESDASRLAGWPAPRTHLQLTA